MENKRFNCIYCSNYCRADNNVRNGSCAKFHKTAYFEYSGCDWGRVKLNGCMYDICSDFNRSILNKMLCLFLRHISVIFEKNKTGN